MFQFPGYGSSLDVTVFRSVGFPHSEIDGSGLVYSSPSLIAAIHVLLRRSMPGHPPYALIHLTILLLRDRSKTRLYCLLSPPLLTEGQIRDILGRSKFWLRMHN